MRNIVISFDIGGTLLYSPDIFENITRKLVGRWPDESTYNRVLEVYREINKSIQKDNSELVFRNVAVLHASALTRLAEKHGYPDISSQAQNICLDVYVYQSSFFPEAELVLENLSPQSVKMIIASDNDSLILNLQIPKFGFDRFFSDYCISETIGAYKPTYRFIEHLKKYLPDDLNDCYFVGDSGVDVESGKRLGIKSVLIDRNQAKKVAGSDYTISNLRELLTIIGSD
jgi:FMN phosphatase YigB (HAD superfamily)